jgi:hypothetical protein
MVKYRIKLRKEEVAELTVIVNKGSHTSQSYRASYVLLNVDEGEFSPGKSTNAEICKVMKIGMRTIDRIKQKCFEGGIEKALEREKGSRIYGKKVDGDLEAHILRLACSEPPEGFARWTLRMLADKVVELDYVSKLSHVSVHNTLKKNELKPWKVKGWVIPPGQDAEFVAHMEQVLDVYKRPYNGDFPVVCMDESPEQLTETVREEPIETGKEKRVDYEYIRHGVANIFMANEPLGGKRLVEVTRFKTKKDWAKFIKRIADEMYPDALKITLVMDNFGTHTAGAFYEAFLPEEAKRLIDRFEFINTPKHGSWLNMAEIELHTLNTQCLKRNIATMEEMQAEVAAWQESRNNKNAKINWKFTTADARIKLKRLYPSFNN